MVYIKVRIFDDILVEGTEAFGVQLSIPDHHKSNGVELGVTSRATVFIKDGEVVILIFLSVLHMHKLLLYCRRKTTHYKCSKHKTSNYKATYH